MTKTLFIVFVFFSSVSYSQYDWQIGHLYLKNGQHLKGYVKLPKPSKSLISLGSNKVAFKSEKKGRTVKYDEKELDKLAFGVYNPKRGYYQYLPIIDGNKFELFKLVLDGKAKLYLRLVSKKLPFAYNTNTFNDYPINPAVPEKENISEYYCIRNGETIATPLITQYSNKTFVELSTDYFSDCQDIVSFIVSGLYDESLILMLVEDYNAICE